MGDVIRVPFGPGDSEFVEKRSRFISALWPVTSEEDAQAFIKEKKAEYYDARHNCWCYRIGQTLARYSDDGEPQGTAGQPMLKVFERENVTDFVCVVTRYFGGILLGAGGLTRAYSRGAKDALVAAGVATMGLWARCTIRCGYAQYERLRLEVEKSGGVVDNVDYGADVVLSISLPAEVREDLAAKLVEMSAATVYLQLESEEYRPGLREEVQ